MMPLAPIVAALVLSAPRVVVDGQDEGPRKIFLELSAGVGRNVPPVGPQHAPHFEWGASLAGTVGERDLFKATLGLQLEHAVLAWAGDGDVVGYVSHGRYSGTTPTDFQGQFLRITPQLRLGAENDQAFGYFGLTPGYALRIAPLTCVTGDCLHARAVDHGLSLGASIGAVIWAVRGLGVGLEAGLDSAYFPVGHGQLARWNQGVSGKLLIGWIF